MWKSYRPRPIEIVARKMPHAFTVKTLEGTMQGMAGDYLVRGTHGEYYPVRADIFEHKYEYVSYILKVPEAGIDYTRESMKVVKELSDGL